MLLCSRLPKVSASLCYSGALLLLLATGAVCGEPAGSDAEKNASGIAEKLPPAAEGQVDFAGDIQPMLAKNCLKCHGPENQESGLRLDRKAAALAGGDSGAVIVPDKSAESLLIHLVAGVDPDRVMPPEDEGERLSKEQIGLLRAWIDQGATWPKEADVAVQEKSDHWAYQPIKRPDEPATNNRGWIRNPIDAFILARLEQAGIAPSPEADRDTLIRRLYLDLLGLPPTPEVVDEFANDDSPDAYEKLVDRLLRSPHFGERWGRHWLDMARYADSDGYEKDNPRPDAWRWRNWVIDAVNADLPFDQFTIEQIAGDLLPNATESQKLATAFHRQTLTNTEGGTDKEQFRIEAVFDRVETISTVWLGLTVGCARCHSHKYDRITQREYYQLFAFLNNGDEVTMDVPLSAEAVARYEDQKPKHDQAVADLTAKLAAHKEELTKSLPAWEADVQAKLAAPAGEDGAAVDLKLPENVKQVLAVAADQRDKKQRAALLDYFVSIDDAYKKLTSELEALKKKTPASPYQAVRIVAERTNGPRTTHMLRRGDFLSPMAAVEPGALAVLPPCESRQESAAGDRLDLARWLVSPDNPLTPRVAVNQMWRSLFGNGLVRTVNDFGVRGDKPTHPELLDWLATEYIRLGWSRKALIKRIVMSAAYRQSSIHRPELVEIDPQNNLLARQNRFRVDAELVRDLSLAAGGLLSAKIGGPSVFPPMPADVAALSYANNFKWNTSKGEDRVRRAMYTFFKRTSPHPNLITFDCPDANTTCVERRTSNTPLQALTTLNNETFVEASQSLARRLLERDFAGDSDRLTYAFRVCVARHPSSLELARFADLLETCRAWYREHREEAKPMVGNYQPANVPVEEVAAWTATARVLLNMDGFLTRE